MTTVMMDREIYVCPPSFSVRPVLDCAYHSQGCSPQETQNPRCLKEFFHVYHPSCLPLAACCVSFTENLHILRPACRHSFPAQAWRFLPLRNPAQICLVLRQNQKNNSQEPLRSFRNPGEPTAFHAPHLFLAFQISLVDFPDTFSHLIQT